MVTIMIVESRANLLGGFSPQGELPLRCMKTVVKIKVYQTCVYPSDLGQRKLCKTYGVVFRLQFSCAQLHEGLSLINLILQELG